MHQFLTLTWVSLLISPFSVSLSPLQASGDDGRPQLISRHWRSGLSVIGTVGNDGGGDDSGEKVVVMIVVKEVAGVDNGRGGSIQLLVLVMLMVMAEVMEMGEGEAKIRGRRVGRVGVDNGKVGRILWSRVMV